MRYEEEIHGYRLTNLLLYTRRDGAKMSFKTLRALPLSLAVLWSEA
jgi:hypothetical protein